MPDRSSSPLKWLTFALVAGAAWACYPLWPALLLAIWVAVLARPLLARVSKITGGRRRAAGALTVMLVLAIALPIVFTMVPLANDAVTLVGKLSKSEGAQGALRSLVSSGPGEEGALQSPGDLLAQLKSFDGAMELVRQHGSAAARIAGQLAGAFAAALLLVFLFFYATYTFLTDGPALYTWFEKHAPLSEAHTARLARAFNETGRGLFVGVGLAGLAQGAVATVAYLVLGVPRALVLGLLTCVTSVIPSVGTAIVWVPVALGLALSGRTGAAITMGVVGVVVVGSIDNLLRPVFARYGELDLSTFALLISIFGGLAAFGGWGVVLGPLLFRLAKEALVILKENQLRKDTGEVSPTD